MSAALVTRAIHRPQLHRVLARAVDAGREELLRQLLDDASAAAATPALRALVKSTVEGLLLAFCRGRVHYPIDAPIFRHHGRACRADGYSPEIITETLDATAEAVRDHLLLPCAAHLCLVELPHRVEAAVVRLCKVMDDFTREAFRELSSSTPN